jgi:2-polyprenyl-3-methyl-5-hydroxy-6-metoxy-1,4-benzoquinol methylase
MGNDPHGLKDKIFFYERFADEFDSKVNMYDTLKRVDVVFNELLKQDLNGKRMLDAGCGTGWFSQAAVRRNARVVSLDLGSKLLAQVAKKCSSERMVGSVLKLPFADNSFDFVVSSEVVEHTPDPIGCIREMFRVLNDGGILVLTTPNSFWYWSVWLANRFHLRPYQGLENWTGWWQMKREMKRVGFTIQVMKGIHLFPFVIKKTHKILDFFHRFGDILGPFMVNIAIRCRKPCANEISK